MAGEESLITVQEAEEVVSAPSGVAQKLRLPLMLFLGALLIVIATLIILLLLSFNGSRTGWDTIFPFLDKTTSQSLQTD